MADSLDISFSEARLIVLRISRGRGWAEPEELARTPPGVQESLLRIRREFGHSVEVIAHDIASQKSRFILELIQNAEDCQFNRTDKVPSLSFEVHPEKIVFESNEDGFTENDVEQICRVGRSWKRQQRGYVGDKGIGFKAVFQVASKVHIQSNSFSFSFEYRADGTSEDMLGIITPIPEDDPIQPNERPLTRMTLTRDATPYERVVNHFEMIPTSLLLFLSKIKEMKIKVHRPNQQTTVTIFSKSEDASSGLTCLTKTTFQDEVSPRETVSQTSLFTIFKTPISGLQDDEARPGINECELVLAFPVDDLDHPLRPVQHDVFAFLPVGTIGFNADFILQASREEVKVDSDWNNDILKHIAVAFCTAMSDFCGRHSILRYQWVKFLPDVGARWMNPFWRKLSSDIIERLQQNNILYLDGSPQLAPPGEVRTLPPDYLDSNGTPLFRDRPGRLRKYLSLEYDPEDIETLKRTFRIQDIEDLAMCHRIEQDLKSSNSNIKSDATDDDWHSRAARLISSILTRNWGTGVGRMIVGGLPLIPLNDERWVCGSEQGIYFPAETGPAIPRDLQVTIHPLATENPSRKAMFIALGATGCPPSTVIDKLWVAYATRSGEIDLTSSIAHMSYLYWNHNYSSDHRFMNLWVYDNRGNKVTSRRKVIYLPSEDEYGPEQLFRSVQYQRRIVPELSVSFLNAEYMNVFPPSTRRHGLSWLNWLKLALGIRHIPRLRFDAGSISTEFRHILQNRPDKIIGTLKKYWTTYRTEMSSAIENEIATANVTCWRMPPIQLKSTYFPMQHLKDKVLNLGIIRGFPFLDVPGSPDENLRSEDWRFLERFGVCFQANIKFYLDVLIQHGSRRQRPWNDDARSDILRTYALVADHYSESNREDLLETFYIENLILDPRSFLPSSTGPIWIDIVSCVWEGPENILDKSPLASVTEYRSQQKLTRLFRDILGIQNANWTDYKRTLHKLKTNPEISVNITDRALRLYKLFSQASINARDWDLIRDYFESEGLIYVPSTSEWFPPSQCLWSSPVSIEGKAIIGNDYPEELRNFFLTRLQISPASLATLVEGLRCLGERDSSVANIKQMIRAINVMNPTGPDLNPLRACNVLPVGELGSDGVRLTHSADNFAVIDRVKLADIFKGHVEFLAFSLEEVRQLDPFIQALELNKKFLSLLCTEKTACGDDGVVDENLTSEFKDRAYDLLRCAVSYRSPLTDGTPQLLHSRLLDSLVLKTDNILTRYTLRHANGDTAGPISQNTGYVFIQDRPVGWRIFVPRDKRNREVSYRRSLPEALTKLFQISTAARENIVNVLNSSSLIIDDLLEAAGIGIVPGIDPPSRNLDEEPNDQQGGIAEEATASNRALRAHSAPLLSARRPLSQPGPSGVARQQRSQPVPDDDPQPVPEDDSQPESEDDSHPASRGSTPLTPQVSPEPVQIPIRGPIIPPLVRPIAYRNDDAYRELLDHVIRIASRTNLPHIDFLPEPANGQFLRGFNHEAAFGVRSQNQMRHDGKIGVAGELFVFELLLNTALHSFGRDNWRSKIRREVTVHPTYDTMEHWDQRETADIVYQDVNGQLSRLLVRLGYLENVWSAARPEYFIEVKTTTGECNDRLFMSKNQYNMMQEMTLQPGQLSERVYIVFRVFNLGKETMNVKLYVDPEAHRRRNALLFETRTWTVRPGP